MIYTTQTKKAIRLMFEKHKEQTDKNGIPYVFHPFYVAEQMPDEKSTVAALLHDVVEDTDCTIEEVRALGFEQDVCDAVLVLTRDETTPYMEYIARVKENPIAKVVKIADLHHNSDKSRLDVVDESAEKRNEKYAKALAFLLS